MLYNYGAIMQLWAGGFALNKLCVSLPICRTFFHTMSHKIFCLSGEIFISLCWKKIMSSNLVPILDPLLVVYFKFILEFNIYSFRQFFFFSQKKESENMFLFVLNRLKYNEIHCLHDFAHMQDSQLNSSVLITVWRAVIEKSVTGLPTK